MDQRLKEIIEHFEKLKIDLDESFRFHCNQCGKCCLNREDILLTARDLFQMSKFLKMETKDFVKQYCECYIGKSSNVPLIRLMPRGKQKRCPLLLGKRCAVHKVKPAVCAMFPVGRCLLFTPKDQIKDLTTNDIQYIFNDPCCGDGTETQTVRAWLVRSGISCEDGFFLEWQKLLMELGPILRDVGEKAPKEMLERMYSISGAMLYFDYDLEKDFDAQFSLRAKALCNSLRKVVDMRSVLNYGR